MGKGVIIKGADVGQIKHYIAVHQQFVNNPVNSLLYYLNIKTMLFFQPVKTVPHYLGSFNPGFLRNHIGDIKITEYFIPDIDGIKAYLAEPADITGG